MSWRTAVAAHLARYKFTLKTKTTSQFDPRLTEPLPDKFTLSPLSQNGEWETGVVYAEAQNLARTVRTHFSLLVGPFTYLVCSSWSILRIL